MAAATGPLTTGHREGEIIPIQLAASTQVWKGAAAAVIYGTGYGTPLVPTTAGMQFIGVWSESYDNTGIAGAYTTQVIRKGAWQFSQVAGLTVANIGDPMYFSDDNTVTNKIGAVFAGTLVAIDASGNAWVDIEQAVRTSSNSNRGNDYLYQPAPVTTTNVSGAAQVLSTLTVGANVLKAGDILKIRGHLIGVTQTSSDTTALNIKFGSTTLFTLAAAFAHATTNFLWFDTQCLILTAGSSGTIIGGGDVSGGTAGATMLGLNKASATFDTTSAEAFTINGTFSASNTTDQIAVNQFSIEITHS